MFKNLDGRKLQILRVTRNVKYIFNDDRLTYYIYLLQVKVCGNSFLNTCIFIQRNKTLRSYFAAPEVIDV